MKTSKEVFSWKSALQPMHWVTVLVVFIVDQAVKWLVILNMRLGESIELLPFFQLVHIKNKGAAFGIFHDASPMFRLVFFGAVTLICLYLLVYWLGTLSLQEKWQRFGLSLILGGALGNLKDRTFFGEVTDFAFIQYKSFSWPAFNVADAAISVGVGIIIVLLIPWGDFFKSRTRSL